MTSATDRMVPSYRYPLINMTVELAPIWLNPRNDDAAPAIDGKGAMAAAAPGGITKPTPKW